MKKTIISNAGNLDPAAGAIDLGFPSFEEWANDRIVKLHHQYISLKRRCDQCGRAFLAKGNHRRAHNFCATRCRRIYDAEHRDPKRQAQYMRAYRKRLRERRQLS